MYVTRKRRGNSRYFVLFFVLMILLVSIFFIARSSLKKVDFFNIQTISIEGNNNLQTEFLVNLVSDLEGRNIIDVSAEEVKSKFSSIVRISDMKIKKKYPSELVVKIKERSGYLTIKTNDGECIPVDQDNVILDNTGFYVNENTPLVELDLSSKTLEVGTEFCNKDYLQIKEFHQLVETNNADLAKKVSEYFYEHGSIYFIESNSGSQVVLGEENIVKKLQYFSFFEQNKGLKPGSVIDMRFNDQIVCRTEKK